MRVEFNIENITSPDEYVKFVRLVMLYNLHIELDTIKGIVETIGNSLEVKLNNINPMLAEIVTLNSERISKELSQTVKPYLDKKDMTTDIALIFSLLALLDTLLEIVSSALGKTVANEIQKLGGVIV